MGTADADDAVETAWQKVLEQWDDDQAHKQFLVLCSSTKQLAQAGKRYRAVREAGDERAEEAKRRIDALLGLAMQDIATLKSPPKQGRGAVFWVATALCIGLVGFALSLVLQAR